MLYRRKMTFILIALNLVVFLAMSLSGVSLVSPEVKDILHWGGNSSYELLIGQWWRLITCMFIHIGAFHFLINMYALYSMGRFLESAIGSYLFFAVYMVSGILSGVVSFLFNQETMIVSAGASGAIAGIFGMSCVILFTIPISVEERKSALLNCMYVIFANVMYAFKSSELDHGAHIGGFACGILLGVVYHLLTRFAFRKRFWHHIYSGAASLVAILVVCATLWGKAPSDSQTFAQLLSQYYEHANNIDCVVAIETDSSFNFVLAELENIKKLLPKFRALELDGSEETFRNYLTHYTELYDQKFHLLFFSDEIELLRDAKIRAIDKEMDALEKAMK